jgi:hypothetical protein
LFFYRGIETQFERGYNACATSKKREVIDMEEFWVLIIIGAVFLLIGIGILILSRREDKEYTDAISSHVDVRRYIEHTSDSHQSFGLKVGGIIAVVIGLILLIMSLIFWLWG